MKFNKFLLPSKNERSKSKKLFFIILFLFFPLALYAGWETRTYLTSPADDDILTIQDVSDTSVNPSGFTKSIRMDIIAAWIKDKIGSFSGAGTSALVPDPITDDGRLLDTGGWTDTVNVDIGGFPSGSIPYADAKGNLQPHPLVSSTELNALDGYNIGSGTIEERFSAMSAGGTVIDITVRGESSNAIAATLQVEQGGSLYSENASIRTWLSATDGGAPGAAFDGNGSDPWVISDATVMTTHSANYDETVLTGSNGDCVITMAHSDASSPATKYLCANYKDTISCAEVTFSADATPCSTSTDYAVDVSELTLSSQGAADSANACQKFKGNGSVESICGAIVTLYKEDGADASFHLEVWDDGASNQGATEASTKLGGDSDSVTVTEDAAEVVKEFTWSSDLPETDGGDFFVHIINDSSGSVIAYARVTSAENTYEDSQYDFWRSGADMSADAGITLKVQ